MSEHPAHYSGEFHARKPPSEPMMKGGVCLILTFALSYLQS